MAVHFLSMPQRVSRCRGSVRSLHLRTGDLGHLLKVLAFPLVLKENLSYGKAESSWLYVANCSPNGILMHSTTLCTTSMKLYPAPGHGYSQDDSSRHRSPYQVAAQPPGFLSGKQRKLSLSSFS